MPLKYERLSAASLLSHLWGNLPREAAHAPMLSGARARCSAILVRPPCPDRSEVLKSHELQAASFTRDSERLQSNIDKIKSEIRWERGGGGCLQK